MSFYFWEQNYIWSMKNMLFIFCVNEKCFNGETSPYLVRWQTNYISLMFRFVSIFFWQSDSYKQFSSHSIILYIVLLRKIIIFLKTVIIHRKKLGLSLRVEMKLLIEIIHVLRRKLKTDGVNEVDDRRFWICKREMAVLLAITRTCIRHLASFANGFISSARRCAWLG